jgi:hypothetical protein
MKKVVSLLLLFSLSSLLLLGCSSHREFSGWSLPKVNPLSWFKKENSIPGVTKPSDIAAGTRTSPPGYASVSSGAPMPGTSSGGFVPGGSINAAQPSVPHSGSISSPGVVWPGPQFQPSGAVPGGSIPGPQTGYYNPQAMGGAGVRVADRSQGMYGGYPGPTTPPNSFEAWNPPSTASSSQGYSPPSQGYSPYGMASPQGVSANANMPVGGPTPPSGTWPQWPNSTSPPTTGPPSAVPPSNWQGGVSQPAGARYDVNASRYSLSGSPQTTPAFGAGAGNPGMGSSGPQQERVWGYTPPNVSPGGTVASSTGTGTPGFGGNINASSGGIEGGYGRSTGAVSSSGSSWGVPTVPAQVQPTGFSTADGVSRSANLATQGGGQPISSRSWNPGGPTPNVPGRVDYQPGNTGYQPGMTGYQPPSPVAASGTSAGAWPGSSGAGTQTPVGQSSQPQGGNAPSGGTTSPFLPGSIRPYVPPNSGSGASSNNSPAGSTLSTTSPLGQLGAAGPSFTGGFCTLDGKCQ